MLPIFPDFAHIQYYGGATKRSSRNNSTAYLLYIMKNQEPTNQITKHTVDYVRSTPVCTK